MKIDVYNYKYTPLEKKIINSSLDRQFTIGLILSSRLNLYSDINMLLQHYSVDISAGVAQLILLLNKSNLDSERLKLLFIFINNYSLTSLLEYMLNTSSNNKANRIVYEKTIKKLSGALSTAGGIIGEVEVSDIHLHILAQIGHKGCDHTLTTLFVNHIINLGVYYTSKEKLIEVHTKRSSERLISLMLGIMVKNQHFM